MAERRPLRTSFRTLASVFVVVLFLVLPVAPASAHVGVDPTNLPARGGWGNVTFTVPTESQDASTTRLEFTFLDDVEFSILRTEPVPGWTATVETADDGTVEGLVWEADDDTSAIDPGEFQSFTIFAGPWPDAESVAVPVDQHYSDGTVVEWNERALDADTQLQYPAPVVPLSESETVDEHGSLTVADNEDDDGDTGGEAAEEATGDTIWRTEIILSGIALVVALAAAGYAGFLHRQLTRSSRSRSDP